MTRTFEIDVDETRSIITVTEEEKTATLAYFPGPQDPSFLEYQLEEHDKYRSMVGKDLNAIIALNASLHDGERPTLSMRTTRALLETGLPRIARCAPHAKQILEGFEQMSDVAKIYSSLIKASEYGIEYINNEKELLEAARSVCHLHKSIHDRTLSFLDVIRPAYELLKK